MLVRPGGGVSSPKAAAPLGGEPRPRSAVGSSDNMLRANHNRHQLQLHSTENVKIKVEPFEHEIDRPQCPSAST